MKSKERDREAGQFKQFSFGGVLSESVKDYYRDLSEFERKTFEESFRKQIKVENDLNKTKRDLLDAPMKPAGFDPTNPLEFANVAIDLDLSAFENASEKELREVNEAIAALQDDFEGFDFGEAFGGGSGNKPKAPNTKTIKNIIFDLEKELRKLQEKNRSESNFFS